MSSHEIREPSASASPTAGTTDAFSGGEPASALAGFEAGQLVAGRYRIVRLVGRGGMGEVFEAEDLELGGRVALKTILPRIARSERAIERFKQEIHLARQVTHPNVCRIFDLEYHQPPAGPAVLFLTMELLQGETLAQRLHRDGRMSEQEALPLVRQMAEALHAAHEAGVVHRDFKSANVLLIPAKAGLRAVVTDFGLACSSAAELLEPGNMPPGGPMVGTPAYIAPEQLEGGPVGPAADLYALGVVLYEMLTGALPFQAPTPMETALMRLEHGPAPPSSLVPGLDPRWEAAILRCLEPLPKDRFATALDLVEALLPPAAQGPVRRRRSVAVLGFKSLSGRPEAAWLSTALAEMLNTELACREQLRVVLGESVARTKLELALGEPDSLSAETLLRLGRQLDSDLIVLGSYLALGEPGGGRIRLDLRVQETASGETLISIAETGSEAGFLDLVEQTGRDLREALGLSCAAGSGKLEQHLAMPRNAEAARLYAQGLEKLRRFHPFDAAGLLRKAVAADPEFALAHSALAQALSDMGYRTEAHQAARSAFELSERLSREDRYLVEGRYHETLEEWSRAAEIYHRLFEFFPDNLGYGLRLGRALVKSGALHEADATIAALRSLPAPACDDAQIDLLELELLDWRGDYKAVQAAAERAVQKGCAQEACLLVAEARTAEAWAWVWLGQPEKGLAAAEAALETYTRLEVRPGLGLALSSMGGLLGVQGRHGLAADKALEATQIFLENGNRSKAAESLGNAVFHQLQRGDLVKAGELLEQMLGLVHGTDDRYNRIFSLFLQPFLLFERGEIEAAHALELQQLAIHEEIGNRRGHSTALRRIGVIRLAQDEIAEARTCLEKAVWTVRELGLGWYVALNEYFLARCLLEQGHAAEAEELARKALCVLEELQAVDYQARARAVLVCALLAQGKSVEAGQVLDVALRLVPGLDSLRARAAVAVAALAVRGDQEQFGFAEAVLAEAERQGAAGTAFDLRLALGKYELSFARREEGRKRLEALAQDAARCGFRLVARKAAAAL